MTLRPYRNDLIKGAMAANDINRDKLAELTGLSLGTISSIRGGGDNVTLSNLIAVAGALGLSMADLFTPKSEQVQEEEPATVAG
ncbi:MAG: helix-turn-helix transcriptional regulator [Pyrinomonadaceae bacterium]